MEEGFFLFNKEYLGVNKYPRIQTNKQKLEIPKQVYCGIVRFTEMNNNQIKLIKFQFLDYEIIIRHINRIKNKSIYQWKCTYKNTNN